jgi:hypothetical protein
LKIINGTIRGGKVTLDVEGFVGTSCVDATKAYVDKLSTNPADVEMTTKEAYHAVEVQQEHG